MTLKDLLLRPFKKDDTGSPAGNPGDGGRKEPRTGTIG